MGSTEVPNQVPNQVFMSYDRKYKQREGRRDLKANIMHSTELIISRKKSIQIMSSHCKQNLNSI